MIGRTNAGVGIGGGDGQGGVGYAAICVAYPVGWICTCEDKNGEVVLRASDTSGKVVFAVPKSGDWIIKITDGTQSNSKTTTVTSANQTVNISISAPSTAGTILYEAGTVGEGYTLNRYNVNAGSKSLTTDGLGSQAAAFTIKPTSGTIDLSKYSKLYVTFQYKVAYVDASAGLGPITTSSNLGSWTYKVPNTAYDDDLAKKTYELNLSSATDSVACFKMGGPANIGIEVFKVWFE